MSDAEGERKAATPSDERPGIGLDRPARDRSQSSELSVPHNPLSCSSSPPPSNPDATSNTPKDDEDNDDKQTTDDLAGAMPPHPYAPLLNCPACIPPARLRAPTTLYCGHTICSGHLHRASSPEASSSKVGSSLEPVLCPLPSCRTTPTVKSVLAPNIPPESPVKYYALPSSVPAPSPEQAGMNRKDPRIDVLLGRVMDLVGLMERSGAYIIDRGGQEEHSDETDGSEEDDEDLRHRHSPKSGSESDSSTSARHRLAQARPERYPRKRLRCELNQSPRASLRHVRDRDMDDFLKELNEVLTCDICSSLLYQPVTTPCQHVRRHYSSPGSASEEI